MNTKESLSNSLKHKQINVNGISIAMTEAGNEDNQTILFLHGYPETWIAFEAVMNELKDNFHLLAIDLPGIGKSDPITSSDKHSIAGLIRDLIESLNMKQIVLAGQDVGGMTTYAFLKLYPEKLFKAVIMNTAIPGAEPWNEVKRNPYIWHFAFFAIPSLPEKLIMGKQRILFDYFYDTLSANKDAIGEEKRNHYAEAYNKPSSLKTSLDWYRAFPQDEKDNSVNSSTDIPVLYLRGEKEYGDINKYIEGLKKSGLNNIRGKLIPDCGHFAPEEQPQQVAKAIHDFIKEL